MVPVLFALGTNLGDREANLRRAIARLRRETTVDAVSAVYETAPMYDTDQGAFLNMCVAARTDLTPEALLARLKAAEAEIGRVPSRPNGPRLIDLDLLLYGDRVVDRPELVVPHPRMAERGFVLAPPPMSPPAGSTRSRAAAWPRCCRRSGRSPTWSGATICG